MLFDTHSLRISSTVIAGIIVGGGAICIILIVVCIICLCCCRRKGKHRKLAHIENPSEAKGDNGGLAQPWQQHQLPNYTPRMEEHRMIPKPPSQSLTQPSQQSSMRVSSIKSKPPRQSSSLGPSLPILSFASSQTVFTYDALMLATNGFSKANLLGQGGFGLVHKGVLPNGKDVAVKSLKNSSGQGNREFQAEVDTVSRVHHRHLVSLVGYCIVSSERLLVYEYVPNKTLEFHIHEKGDPTMDWPTRLKVAIGAAKGLAYMHEDCHPRIIHRDIKAANILLDKDFQAKVADFGLAKFSLAADTHVSTRVMGTLGYLSPEYAATGKLSEKSDVYSFGVVLLELITGRRPLDRKQKENNLVAWARPLLTGAIEDENFNYLVDPRLQNCYKHSEMARVVSCAASCVRKSAKLRPLMSQVLRALEGNITLSELSEGLTPGRSLVPKRYESSLQNNGSKHMGDSTGFSGVTSQYSESYVSSELDGTTGEYGLYSIDVHSGNKL